MGCHNVKKTQNNKYQIIIAINQNCVSIQADYIGRSIDTFASEKVMVHWAGNFGKDEVVLV